MSGYVHLYYGDGKGKTTAAAGLALRAAAAGMGVCVVQFLKGRESGEMRILAGLAERAKTLVMSNRNIESAYTMAVSGRAELVILDEVCAAWREDLVNHALVEKFIKERPDGVELVLTGRNPPSEFLEAADYATEFVKVRHPFDRGLGAREGIEY